jgi:hypothetical protein
MNQKLLLYMIGGLFLMCLAPSCSLNENILDQLTSDIVKKDTNLIVNAENPALGQLRNMWWRQDFWGFQEATSDECFFPTRGTDWYDGGVWQDDYFLAWKPSHRDVVSSWNTLSTAVATCNSSLFALGDEKASDGPKVVKYRSQNLFLRSFYEYAYFDLFRIVPFRTTSETDFSKAAKFFKGSDAFYHIVSTVKAQLPKIVTREKALYGEPNRDAALMLLAKMYLNEEVYIGVAGYDSCLIYLNELLATNHYSLANNYFNMFTFNNDVNYKKPDDEAIFVAVYNDDQDYGMDSHFIWVQQTFHYNQTIGGAYIANWNGCVAPEGYLLQNWIAGTDTAADLRWKDKSIYPTMAVNLGFNYGQQYDTKGKIIKDRNGNLLNFTFSCSFLTAKEYEGVRVLKYCPKQYPPNLIRVANDFIIWRYADVLLMKAECLARAQSDVSGAVTLVNTIRTKRKAPVISAATVSDALNKIYIERGLELYWEGHRRQDMIRFGTYLLPKSEKPDGSPDRAKILPIPQPAIDGTPGGVLKQNPGY